MSTEPLEVQERPSQDDERSTGGSSTPATSLEDEVNCPTPCRHHPLYSKFPDGLTTRPHLSSLGKFVTDVSTAVKNCFPRKPRQYDKGHAIFIRWKEDDIEGTADQIRVLREHFERLRFTADPSQFSTSVVMLEPEGDNNEDNVYSTLQLQLLEKRIEFGRQADSLLIIYYGGHGKMVKRDCVWYAHENFKDCQREGRTLNWSKMAKDLVSGPGNMLFIIDSCSAVGMGIPDDSGGLKELFGACGINDVTSASESNAFTNCINMELNKLRRQKSQLNISALYATLLKSYKDKLKSTPHRIALSPRATTESIDLHYGVDDAPDSTPPGPTTTQETLDFNTRVLVAIRLQNPALTPRVDDWTTWIKSHAPAGIIGVDVSLAYVHPVSLHQSRSSLLLVSLPMVVWSLMPHHPACTFIDLIQSDNLLSFGPQKPLGVKLLEPDVEESRAFLEKGKAKIWGPPADEVEQHQHWSSTERTTGMRVQRFVTPRLKELSLSAKTANDPSQKGLFACPYYRRNPRSNPKCEMLRTSRIKDIISHLKKKHTRPLYCPICGSCDFGDSEEARDEHVKLKKCSPPPGGLFIQGMNEVQLQVLSRRRVRGTNDAQRWLEIWSILFPGDQPPSSPFAGDHVEEVIGKLCDYWNANSLDLLSKPLLLYLGDQPEVREAASNIVAATLQRLLDGFLNHLSSAGPPVHPEVSGLRQSSVEAADETVVADEGYNPDDLKTGDVTMGMMDEIQPNTNLSLEMWTYPAGVTELPASDSWEPHLHGIRPHESEHGDATMWDEVPDFQPGWYQQ